MREKGRDSSQLLTTCSFNISHVRKNHSSRLQYSSKGQSPSPYNRKRKKRATRTSRFFVLKRSRTLFGIPQVRTSFERRAGSKKKGRKKKLTFRKKGSISPSPLRTFGENFHSIVYPAPKELFAISIKESAQNEEEEAYIHIHTYIYIQKKRRFFSLSHRGR